MKIRSSKSVRKIARSQKAKGFLVATNGGSLKRKNLWGGCPRKVSTAPLIKLRKKAPSDEKQD